MNLVKTANNFNVVKLGGEHALMPNLDSDNVSKEKSKVVILNESAFNIFCLIEQEKDVDKVIELLSIEYDDDKDYIKNIVMDSLNRLVAAGIFIYKEEEVN